MLDSRRPSAGHHHYRSIVAAAPSETLASRPRRAPCDRVFVGGAQWHCIDRKVGAVVACSNHGPARSWVSQQQRAIEWLCQGRLVGERGLSNTHITVEGYSSKAEAYRLIAVDRRMCSLREWWWWCCCWGRAVQAKRLTAGTGERSAGESERHKSRRTSHRPTLLCDPSRPSAFPIPAGPFVMGRGKGKEKEGVNGEWRWVVKNVLLHNGIIPTVLRVPGFVCFV
jgi:hypothetical protein